MYKSLWILKNQSKYDNNQGESEISILNGPANLSYFRSYELEIIATRHVLKIIFVQIFCKT